MDAIQVVSTVACFSTSAILGLVALNSQQTYRPILLCLLTIFSALAFRGISVEALSIEGCHILAMFVLFYISHMTCALLLEKYRLPIEEAWSWRAAYKMLFNARWIGTERQVPDIVMPSIPGSDISPQEMKPETRPLKRLQNALKLPRVIFVRNRLASLFVIYVLSKAFATLPEKMFSSHFGPLGIEDFLPSQHSYFRRLSEVTFRETALRIWISAYFVWSTFSSLTMIHHVLAIVFIGTGVDEPKDWPSLYGNITEAYSVRRLWGKFWHKLVYRSYTSYGIFISSRILGLPKKSMVGRLFINFFVFFLSGCVHGLVQLQLGYSCGWKEDIAWYSLCFFMIMAETLFTFLAKKALGRYWQYLMADWVCKPLGFLWVGWFLFWSLPKSQYPKMFCFPDM
jgi:hypothetical protein